MPTPLHPATRIVLLTAVLSMAGAGFLPLWEIQLWAPQYPEGLNMKIWIDHLSGAFEIINGLNHYIGMATINEEMFPEFRFMVYLLGALVALGLVPAWKGSRKWLWIFVSALALAGLAGLADFYRWGYSYGHNLNPDAPIRVPGMTYQPPLIGYKNLLNFTAYSGPAAGGWVLIIAGMAAAALLGWEQFLRGRPTRWWKPGRTSSLAPAAVALLMALGVAGCELRPEPVRYGKDECAECKMIISDRRFGAELVTRKGKVFKFDDFCCMNEFLERQAVPREAVGLQVISDFARPGEFVPAAEAYLLKSRKLSSPMRGDCAAFSSEAACRKVKEELGEGQVSRWPPEG